MMVLRSIRRLAATTREIQKSESIFFLLKDERFELGYQSFFIYIQLLDKSMFTI